MSVSVVLFLNILSAIVAFIITVTLMKMMGYSKYARETQIQARIEDYKKQETRTMLDSKTIGISMPIVSLVVQESSIVGGINVQPEK